MPSNLLYKLKTIQDGFQIYLLNVPMKMDHYGKFHSLDTIIYNPETTRFAGTMLNNPMKPEMGYIVPVDAAFSMWSAPDGMDAYLNNKGYINVNNKLKENINKKPSTLILTEAPRWDLTDVPKEKKSDPTQLKPSRRFQKLETDAEPPKTKVPVTNKKIAPTFDRSGQSEDVFGIDRGGNASVNATAATAEDNRDIGIDKKTAKKYKFLQKQGDLEVYQLNRPITVNHLGVNHNASYILYNPLTKAFVGTMPIDAYGDLSKGFENPGSPALALWKTSTDLRTFLNNNGYKEIAPKNEKRFQKLEVDEPESITFKDMPTKNKKSKVMINDLNSDIWGIE